MINWLSYYDWVMGPDGPDPKPEEHILEDDDALDAFIEKWKRDLKKGNNSGSGTNTKTFEIDQSG